MTLLTYKAPENKETTNEKIIEIFNFANQDIDDIYFEPIKISTNNDEIAIKNEYVIGSWSSYLDDLQNEDAKKFINKITNLINQLKEDQKKDIYEHLDSDKANEFNYKLDFDRYDLGIEYQEADRGIKNEDYDDYYDSNDGEIKIPSVLLNGLMKYGKIESEKLPNGEYSFWLKG